MRKFLTITLVLAVIALSTIATASPAKCVYLFEVWNNTFQPANGFHVLINGVAKSDTDPAGFWGPDYPNMTVSDVSGGVQIDWTGAMTLVGGASMFGFTLTRSAPLDSMQMSWTKDGAQYCLIPSVWQDWTANGGSMRATVTNRSGQQYSIRRIAGFNYDPVTCADLAAMEYPWDSVWMDNPSLSLDNNSSSDYDSTHSGVGSYLMYYDLFNGSGGDWIRFRNAAVVSSVPGPQFSMNVPINDQYWYPGFGPSSNIPMLSANASSTSQECYRITSLDLHMSGNHSAEAGSATIDVWIDANGNGEVDSETDTHVGSGVYPGSDQPLAISLSPEVNIPAGGTVPLLITCTLASPPPEPGSGYGFDLWNAEAYGVPSGDPAPPNGLWLDSGRLEVVTLPISMGDAKKLPINPASGMTDWVFIKNNTITANFQTTMGLVYGQGDSAGLGVTVREDDEIPPLGSPISLFGRLTLLDNCELVMVPEYGFEESSGPPVTPRGMTNRASGGGAFGRQPAVKDDASVVPAKTARGLSNVGMLVKICGAVTGTSQITIDGKAYDAAWLNDGSGLKDGFGGLTGIAVIKPADWTGSNPSPGWLMSVTGILRAVPNPAGLPVRVLVPRTMSDAVVAVGS